jgi:inositol phosphorylceramide synthase catalytic subunit
MRPKSADRLTRPSFIPYDYRPHIWVRVLPALENVLYGANLSNILSAHQHFVLDLLAWLPYGIMHYGAPAVCSIVLFVFGAPGTLPVFARCFGWLSILGVTIQLVFPCTPPWYENERGLVPAAYGMPGSPAGLARLDELFGVDLYTTNFSSAPVPFGAFPSLHSAFAVLEALFMSHCFPRLRVVFVVYSAWVWWATMYLSHHYAVDLVGGGLLSAVFFYTARARWLPRRQPGKLTRWHHEYVEIGDRDSAVDEEHGGHYLSATLLKRRSGSTSDEWTLGSGASWSSGSGTLSPTSSASEATTPSYSMDLESRAQIWDATAVPPREVHLHEVVSVR